MKTAILTGPFPPQNSGVGDHAHRLAKELVRLGHSVSVWTAEPHPIPSPEFQVHSVQQPWGLKQLKVIEKQILQWNPDQIVIEYTPQSMAPHRLGVHLTLPFWLWSLKRKSGKPILLVAHELNYPVEWSLPGILIGIPHLLQLFGFLSLSSRVFCSTEHFTKKVLRLFGWALSPSTEVTWLPIGSNIDCAPRFASAQARIEFRAQHGIPAQNKLLLHFGGLHPTHLYDYVLHTFRELQKSQGKDALTLVCIGITQEQFKAKLSVYQSLLGQGSHEPPWLTEDWLKKNQNHMKFVGYLPASEVSAWLYATDLVLAPFMDGVSTRRSTVMAAFAHGCSVLTTVGYGSAGATPWSKLCATTSCGALAEYSKKALELLANEDTRAHLGSAAKQYYDDSLDWPSIAQHMTPVPHPQAPRSSSQGPRKILHVYSGNLYGGIERVLATLAEYQKATPNLTHEFALCFEGRLSNELKKLNCSVHLLSHHLQHPRWSRPWSIIQVRHQLRRVLSSTPYDAVICHAPWSLGIFGKTVLKQKTPLVFWAHETFSAKGWIEKLALRVSPTAVISNSAYTLPSIQKHFPTRRFTVVYCPISPTPLNQKAQMRSTTRKNLGFSQQEFLLLQVSRMEPWKGQRVLLESLAFLDPSLPWQALVVGGPQRPKEARFLEELRALAAKLKLQDRVHFLGQRSDVTELMMAADLYVQPNLSPEGFGISIVEAMYCALPIVSVAGGGVSETVTTQTGVLISRPDPRLLGTAIQSLIQNPASREWLSGNGPPQAKMVSDPAQKLKEIEAFILELKT